MQRILAILSTCALALVVGIACGDTSVGSSTANLEHDGSGSGSGMGSGSGSGSGSGMGADCTPGFYKNHSALWDHIDGNCGDQAHKNCGPFPDLERACCLDALCTAETLADLQDQSPRGEGEAIRGAAKAFLDACFGDEEPCEDD
jgi:hypothetical protein